MQCEARARQSRQPYTARPGRITRCARATAATEILAQPRPNSATAPPPPYSRQASTTPWGAVGGRPNSKAPNRRVSIENQQSNRARGGAPITTLCLDFYGHVGIMPNSSDTLNKRGFSLSLLQNFGERLLRKWKVTFEGLEGGHLAPITRPGQPQYAAADPADGRARSHIRTERVTSAHRLALGCAHCF